MSIKRLLVLILALIALLILVQLLAYALGGRQPQTAPSSSSAPTTTQGARIPPPQPPVTPADTVAQQDMHPFSLLISYTDAGFEPALARIRAGDTVRFTNNSTNDLWVASSGAQLYPSVQNDCGSSAFDSCQALHPGEFWEFTFTEKGTWQYMNNLDKLQEGTIVVQ